MPSQNVTIKLSGGDYSTLITWESTEQQDLVSAEYIHTVTCDPFEDDAGTSAFLINGWTASATYYINIQGAGTCAMPWDETATFTWRSSNGATAFQIYAANGTRVSDFQIHFDSAAGSFGVNVNTINDCVFDRVIVKAENPNRAFLVTDDGGAFTAKNLLIWTNNHEGAATTVPLYGAGTKSFYNCAVVAASGTSSEAFHRYAGAVNLYNCVTFGHTAAGNDYVGTITSNYCATNQASGDSGIGGDTGAVFGITDLWTSLATLDLTWTTFAALTAAGGNYDGIFTLDILGTTRPGSPTAWDIGPYQSTQELIQKVQELASEFLLEAQKVRGEPAEFLLEASGARGTPAEFLLEIAPEIAPIPAEFLLEASGVWGLPAEFLLEVEKVRGIQVDFILVMSRARELHAEFLLEASRVRGLPAEFLLEGEAKVTAIQAEFLLEVERVRELHAEFDLEMSKIEALEAEFLLEGQKVRGTPAEFLLEAGAKVTAIQAEFLLEVEKIRSLQAEFLLEIEKVRGLPAEFTLQGIIEKVRGIPTEFLLEGAKERDIPTEFLLAGVPTIRPLPAEVLSKQGTKVRGIPVDWFAYRSFAVGLPADFWLAGFSMGGGTGRREFLADFADGNVFGTSFLRRPDAVSRSMLNAFAPGPRALNDSTEGLLVKGWTVRADNSEGKVYITEAKDETRLGWHDEAEWFSYTGDDIKELDFAFDQNGAPVLVAQRGTNLWIYYFKPSASEYVFEDFGPGLYPKILLDNPFHVDDSDLLVWYSAGGFLVYRKQRDLYVSSNATAIGLSGAQYVEGTVVDDRLRIHVIISTRNAGAGTWSLERMTSELYPYYGPPEYMLVSSKAIAGEVLTVIIRHYTPADELLVANSTPQAVLEYVVWEEDHIDNPAFDATIDDVQVILAVEEYTTPEEELDVANSSIAGTIDDLIIEYVAPEEEIDVANSSIAGSITTP